MRHNFYKAAIIAAVAFLMLAPHATRAGVKDWFKGWSWSPNLGWLSLNSTNLGLAIDYGVTVTPANGNAVTGWAWSSNVGWICFGNTCVNPNNSGLCPSYWQTFLGTTAPAASMITTGLPYQLLGWARLASQDYALNGSLTPAERCDQGWISLNCLNKGTCATSPYNVNVYTTNGYALNGFAWSSVSPRKYGGLGWIKFDPNYNGGEYQLPDVYKGAKTGVPWLQVVYGSLYSKGNVSTFTPFAQTFGQSNAAYCIDTGAGATVTNMNNGVCTAAAGSSQIPAGQTLDVNAPTGATHYSNLFGKIDFAGIHNGRYGTVNTSSPTPLNITNFMPSVLAGAIYETDANNASYVINAKQFNNAAGNGNGSGLLIVHGNLRITGDLTYQNGTITKLSQLASLGILVLDDGSKNFGNITIDPGVKTVSADLFAEGTIATGTTGVVSTEVPLTINGVTVAKKYNLQRLYPGSPTQPAEKIIYDGRIIANTPPGMSNLVQSLPIISN
jgi:hypothetical protein